MSTVVGCGSERCRGEIGLVEEMVFPSERNQQAGLATLTL